MAQDLIHDAVKNALEKADWQIIADPFRLDFKNFTLRADIAAKHLSHDGEDEVRIIVEVKSFVGNSFVRELQQAIGQYLMYQDAIRLNELDYSLYLGISADAFISYFAQSGTQFAVQQYHLKLLVVDIAQEEILQWIE